jgi:hypothetical protein
VLRHKHSPHVAVQLHPSSSIYELAFAGARDARNDKRRTNFSALHLLARGEFASGSDRTIEDRNLESGRSKPRSTRHLYPEAVLQSETVEESSL